MLHSGTFQGMQLEEEDIREFSELWKLEFRETLSPGEAQARASVLLEFYALLARAPSGDGETPSDDPIP